MFYGSIFSGVWIGPINSYSEYSIAANAVGCRPTDRGFESLYSDINYHMAGLFDGFDSHFCLLKIHATFCLLWKVVERKSQMVLGFLSVYHPIWFSKNKLTKIFFGLFLEICTYIYKLNSCFERYVPFSIYLSSNGSMV